MTDIDIPVSTRLLQQDRVRGSRVEGGRRRPRREVRGADRAHLRGVVPRADVTVRGVGGGAAPGHGGRGRQLRRTGADLLGYEPDAAVLGQPFFVMGFTEGRIPADQPRYSQEGFLVDEATPEERHQMVATGMEAMGQIHSIDWRRAILDWLGAGGEANRPRRCSSSSTGHPPGENWPSDRSARRGVRVAGGQRSPRRADRTVVGATSQLGNVIWRDYRFAAVVDWEACALSPTEADVGWWLMFDRMTFDELGAPRMEGFPTREEMIDLYEKSCGRTVRDPHYWEVFGTMRFCAIFIGLGDRMTNGGLVPAELNMGVANMVTQSLADLLDIDNPTPAAF
ncbi:MAG: phosphotransferase family protein [Acidimicrobiales bacterium]